LLLIKIPSVADIHLKKKKNLIHSLLPKGLVWAAIPGVIITSSTN